MAQETQPTNPDTNKPTPPAPVTAATLKAQAAKLRKENAKTGDSLLVDLVDFVTQGK